MLQPEKPRLLFVINPVSGGKKKADPELVIREFFKNRPELIEIYLMQGANDDESLSHYIKRWQPNVVIAAGGDGTVRMVASHLLNTGIPMGILPAGSANGMAAELCLPQDMEQAINVIVNGVVKEIDVIRVNDDICIHLGDIGLNALLVRNFERQGVRGKLGYARAVLKTLYHRQLMEVYIDNGDISVQRNAFMIVLANARMYGTGACINPDGELGDGIFEVVILRRLSVLELLKMLFRHRPFNPEKTEIIKARKVIISTRKRAHFQVDGEYLGKTHQVQAHILPQQLRIVVTA